MLSDLQCAWPVAHPPAISRPTSLPAVRVAMTTPCGDACSRCWAKRITRTLRSPLRAALPWCLRTWEAWACGEPHAPPPLHILGCLGRRPACFSRSLPRRRGPLPCRAHPRPCFGRRVPARRSRPAVRYTLNRASCTGRSFWCDKLNDLRPTQCDLPEPGERCQGWLRPFASPCPGHAALGVGAARCSLGSVPPRARLAPLCRPTTCS